MVHRHKKTFFPSHVTFWEATNKEVPIWGKEIILGKKRGTNLLSCEPLTDDLCVLVDTEAFSSSSITVPDSTLLDWTTTDTPSGGLHKLTGLCSYSMGWGEIIY